MCPEVMDKPTILPDSNIKVYPSGSPADVRVDGKGVSLPLSQSPYITVTLTQSPTEPPALVDKIVLTGNAGTVKIFIQTYSRPNEPAVQFTPVTDPTDNDQVFDATYPITFSTPLLSDEIKIMFITTTDNSPDLTSLTLSVHACIKPCTYDITAHFDKIVHLH